MAEVVIRLENENGELKEYKAGKIMARTTRDAMKMYSKMEETDKDGKPLVSDVESLDLMIELVADSIFKREPEVTVDSILDGIEADKLTETLQDIIMKTMGIDEQEVADAQEGK